MTSDELRDKLHYHASQMRTMLRLARELLTIAKNETDGPTSEELARIGTELCDIADAHNDDARSALDQLRERNKSLQPRTEVVLESASNLYLLEDLEGGEG